MWKAFEASSVLGYCQLCLTIRSCWSHPSRAELRLTKLHTGPPDGLTGTLDQEGGCPSASRSALGLIYCCCPAIKAVVPTNMGRAAWQGWDRFLALLLG